MLVTNTVSSQFLCSGPPCFLSMKKLKTSIHTLQDSFFPLQTHTLGVDGGGPLVFEVGYHPRKKIHIITLPA